MEYQSKDGAHSLAIGAETYGPGARRSGFPQRPSSPVAASVVSMYASSQRFGELFHTVAWCYDREHRPLLILWC